jgi:hypothetical protein
MNAEFYQMRAKRLTFIKIRDGWSIRSDREKKDRSNDRDPARSFLFF